MYDVAYYGPTTAVLLNWDTTGSYFACNLAPRFADGSLDPDYQHWLSVNEVVAARGADSAGLARPSSTMSTSRLRRGHGACGDQPARFLHRRAAWRLERPRGTLSGGWSSIHRRMIWSRSVVAILLVSCSAPTLSATPTHIPIVTVPADSAASKSPRSGSNRPPVAGTALQPPSGRQLRPSRAALGGFPDSDLCHQCWRWLGRPVRGGAGGPGLSGRPGSIGALAPWLDISGRISSGGERGLLGLAFHPDFATNGRFFVDYTDSNGNTVISEFDAVPPTERWIRRPSGCCCTSASRLPTTTAACSPSGRTAICTSGSATAARRRSAGQRPEPARPCSARSCASTSTRGDPYGIPPTIRSQPVRAGRRPEIWDWGVRNPWRFSFDRESGGLFIGDVGQNQTEEIDVEPAGDGRPQLRLERHGGRPLLRRGACDQTGLTLPRADLLARRGLLRHWRLCLSRRAFPELSAGTSTPTTARARSGHSTPAMPRCGSVAGAPVPRSCLASLISMSRALARTRQASCTSWTPPGAVYSLVAPRPRSAT